MSGKPSSCKSSDSESTVTLDAIEIEAGGEESSDDGAGESVRNVESTDVSGLKGTNGAAVGLGGEAILGLREVK